MAKLTSYLPNRRGLRGLLSSRAVDEMLEGRADRVAAAARAAYAQHGHDVDVEVVQAGSDTSSRARVAVVARHPAALRIEQQERPLGGSLDAARR